MLPGGEIPPEGEAPQAPDHGPEQSGSHPCLGDSKLFLYLLPQHGSVLSGPVSAEWNCRHLTPLSGVAVSAEWNCRHLTTLSGVTVSAEWNCRHLSPLSGVTVSAESDYMHLHPLNLVLLCVDLVSRHRSGPFVWRLVLCINSWSCVWIWSFCVELVSVYRCIELSVCMVLCGACFCV